MKIILVIIPICVAIFGIVIVFIPSDPSSVCSENELEWIEEKQFCIGMSPDLCDQYGGNIGTFKRGAEMINGTQEDVLYIHRGCQFQF